MLKQKFTILPINTLTQFLMLKLNHTQNEINKLYSKAVKHSCSYPLGLVAMFVLGLSHHLLLVSVELDGLLVEFIHSLHQAAELTLQNTPEKSET